MKYCFGLQVSGCKEEHYRSFGCNYTGYRPCQKESILISQIDPNRGAFVKGGHQDFIASVSFHTNNCCGEDTHLAPQRTPFYAQFSPRVDTWDPPTDLEIRSGKCVDQVTDSVAKLRNSSTDTLMRIEIISGVPTDSGW